MKCTLIVVNDTPDAGSWNFNQDRIIIGRLPDMDLILDDVNVSRNHAEIVRKGTLFEIIDLESKNGIKLNGKKITRAILHNRDKIEIGNIILEFQCETLVAEDDKTIIMGGETMIFNAPKLVVDSGEKKGKEYLINKGILTIGRLKDNDIVLDNNFVSRHHARILLHDENVTIKDLGSGNGSYVNGKRIDETILKSGDEIKIGGITLKFLEYGAALPIEKEPVQQVIQKTTRIPYLAIIAASLFLIIFLIVFFILTGKKEEKVVQQQEPANLSKNLAIHNQGQTDMAVSMLREIQKSKPAAEQAEQPAQQIASIDKNEKTSQPKTVANKDQQPSIPNFSDALALYTQGLADDAIAMLKEINLNNDDEEESTRAATYITTIKKMKESFDRGTELFEEKSSEKAFAEWKKALVLEKELPLEGTSWYTKKIAHAAADELYQRGLTSYNKGDKEAAVKNWKKVIEIVPNHKKALARLAEIAR